MYHLNVIFVVITGDFVLQTIYWELQCIRVLEAQQLSAFGIAIESPRAHSSFKPAGRGHWESHLSFLRGLHLTQLKIFFLIWLCHLCLKILLPIGYIHNNKTSQSPTYPKPVDVWLPVLELCTVHGVATQLKTLFRYHILFRPGPLAAVPALKLASDPDECAIVCQRWLPHLRVFTLLTETPASFRADTT